MTDFTKKINLRELDDVACSNVVVSRQIRRMIKKVPSYSDLSMSCHVRGTHYTHFKFEDEKFIWNGSVYDKRYGKPTITSDDCGDLDKSDINKLLKFTFSAMCENNSIEITDTPEDLLALAESKLQELLNSESQDADM